MSDQQKEKWELCTVGLFKLPGVVFQEDVLTKDTRKEMKKWAKQNKCGEEMTDRIWSFRTSGQRDMFIMRWGDVK